MSSTSSTSSSSDEEESTRKKQNTFIVKKPHFLKRARTLPHELRLLKQRQDGRRRELERRQHDDIIDHLSVIEMELSEVNQLLDEDVEKNIKDELISKYNIPRPTVPILNEIYSKPSLPILDLSTGEYEIETKPVWEANTPPASCEIEENNCIVGLPSTSAIPLSSETEENNCIVNVPSTSAIPSSTWQNSTEQHSPFTETKETTTDIELVEEVDSGSDSDDVIIVEEIENNTTNKKSAYQRYREMLELWNRRVSRIKEELRNKYRTSQTSASSFRIQNFKNLLCYVREIEILLQKPNIMRDEEHYAQLQARVSITKFMEVCDLGQFNYLDGKSILTLRQADKELAEFQYEWWKSKMNSIER